MTSPDYENETADVEIWEATLTYPEGALWRVWDLHVHTPASVVNNYPGEPAAKWEAFFDDLRALPPQFAAIGINDYLTVDGYERVAQERESGRLPNIGLVLPVVELRLAAFGGTEGKLSRVNLHVIFSNALSPQTIREQFLMALSSKYTLSPELTGRVEWNEVPTTDSITKLGRLIRETSPEALQLDPKNDYHLGFHNLNFSLYEVKKALERTSLRGRAILAVGKTEWADVKWNQQSIAEKKTLINSVDFVFTAADSQEICEKSKRKLTEEKVNNRLLDCSDAHSLSSSDEKDRLGNCLTWVKADPTFNGLLQALKTYDNRVFLGTEPPKLAQIRAHGRHFVTSVRISPIDAGIPGEPWFSVDIPLNPDLVAIIGRKGSGKSALTDALALALNSDREDKFSFLNKKRFRLQRDNKAQHFRCAVTLADESLHERGLADHHDEAAPPLVKYLPQSLFEDICSGISAGQDAEFRQELEAVIFSQLPVAEQLGTTSLEELLGKISSESQRSIDQDRARIAEINRKVIAVEEELLPAHRDRVVGERREVYAKIAALDALKPDEVAEPPEDGQTEGQAKAVEQIASLEKDIEDLQAQLESASAAQKKTTSRLHSIGRVTAALGNLGEHIKGLEADLAEDLEAIGVKWSEVLTYEIRVDELATRRAELKRSKDRFAAQIADEGEDSLPKAIRAKKDELDKLAQVLDAPRKKYQDYRKKLASWEAERLALVGSKDAPGTIMHLEEQLRLVDEAAERLRELDLKREEISKRVLASLYRIGDSYRKLYVPVQTLIGEYPELQGQLNLSFSVDHRDSGIRDFVLDLIRRNVKSSFSGDEGLRRLDGVVEACDFNSAASVLQLVRSLTKLLRFDNSSDGEPRNSVPGLLKKDASVEALYAYLHGFEFLEPVYALKMGGLDIQALSPGERGTLLIVFYLLIDRQGPPLVLDQPDENLDNETVFRILVPCIREARKSRQVIVVTHNPNIAVVCDAEQIVLAEMIKDGHPEIRYSSGSIESEPVNKSLLDVLEGTRPAFSDRDSKYFADL